MTRISSKTKSPMKIGGKVVNGTSGSVLFVDSSGNLAQDNSNLFWDDANNRLGIGTVTPNASLNIKGNDRLDSLRITGFGVDQPGIYIERAAGDKWNIFNRNSGDGLAFYEETSGSSGYRLFLQEGGNIGIGNTSPSTKLDVTGVITATNGNSTEWNTAYTHSQNNSQAHSDYLINNGDDTTTGRLTMSALTVDTNTLYVDETNNRVGIGTASPADTCHITDGLLLGSDSVNKNTFNLLYGNTTLVAGDVGAVRFDAVLNPVDGTTGTFSTLHFEGRGLTGCSAATMCMFSGSSWFTPASGKTWGYVKAFDATALYNAGAGTISNYYGIDTRVRNYSSGQITNAYGGRFGNNNNTGGGNMYYSHGVLIENQTGGSSRNNNLVIGTAANGNYSIYNSSTYDNYFAGKLGIGIVPTAKLHVDQSSTTAAIPVLYLDQADVSEEMIEFNTTVGTGNAIEAVGAKVLITTHFIKVTITGVGTRYIPVGTIT